MIITINPGIIVAIFSSGGVPIAKLHKARIDGHIPLAGPAALNITVGDSLETIVISYPAGNKTLGSAVIQAVREQAKTKNFKFEQPRETS